jgi:molybdopterin-guanine dinucleotide biosynthesis protein A
MKAVPEVWGLVLAGGQSTRMGHDKGLLQYHQKSQRLHIFEELKKVCPNTFISLRENQVQTDIDSQFQIVDENRFKGPFNGLLSAYHKYPEVAWLVVACDLPLLDVKGIRYLIQNRNPNAVATALARTDSNLPEPLVAIWEPLGLKMAESYLENSETSCPRKFLIRHNCSIIPTANNDWLENANDPEDYIKIRKTLSKF